MTPLAALAAAAASQHHLVTTADLRRLGWSKDAIRHLVRTERIFRVHRGVYVTGRRELDQQGRWAAAVLASSAGGALGLLSASVFRDLLEYDAPLPQVIVPMSRSRHRRPGIDVHRSSTLTEADVEVVDGIRVTRVLRTLSDLALTPLRDQTLQKAVRQAARLHKVELQELRGKPRLDRIVRLYDPLTALTESDFEAIFLALCTRYRLPLRIRRRGSGAGAPTSHGRTTAWSSSARAGRGTTTRSTTAMTAPSTENCRPAGTSSSLSPGRRSSMPRRPLPRRSARR